MSPASKLTIVTGPGTPVFYIRNLTTTHESPLHDPIYTLIHDPADASVPPYHPGSRPKSIRSTII